MQSSPGTAGVKDVRAWLNDFETVHLDLGTGDGTFALHMARTNPDMAVIGVDTCLANLSKAARSGPANLRVLTCDATMPPAWLHGAATSLSINFPYGSLLRALLGNDTGAQRGLFAASRPASRFVIRINGSAATEMGLAPEMVAACLRRLAGTIAARSVTVEIEPHQAYRRFSSTWAKRLAYGRPSDVVLATGIMGG